MPVFENSTTMIIAGTVAGVVIIALGLVVLGYVGRTWPIIGPALEPIYQTLETIRRTLTDAVNSFLNALYNFFVLPFVEIGRAIQSWFTGLQQTLMRGWTTLGSYWWVPVAFVLAFPILVVYLVWSYKKSIKRMLRG